MKRLMLLATLGAGLAVVGCDDPTVREAEVAPPAMEVPVAPSAEDMAADAAATGAATDQPPVDATLPPEVKSSEESVQPESETLFY